MHVSFQIIIAALSVIGLFFCLKTVASLIFTSRQIAATVIIENKNQLTELDLLLPEASSALFAARRRRITVIVSKEVWNACDEKEKSFAEDLIDCFGAEIYII